MFTNFDAKNTRRNWYEAARRTDGRGATTTSDSRRASVACRRARNSTQPATQHQSDDDRNHDRDPRPSRRRAARSLGSWLSVPAHARIIASSVHGATDGMSAIKAVVAWESTRVRSYLERELVLRTQSQVLFVGRSSSQAGKSYGALPLQTDSQFFF